MGLKIETWNIAYRNKKNGLLLKDTAGFQIIKNGHRGWYADPFLFDYKNETYLFAEFFSYKLSRGVIVYSKFNRENNKFEDFREIIKEEYHLSYPLIFRLNNDIYMLPESNESNKLFMYKAISFPDKWEKQIACMDNIKLVDTTPFFVNDKLYALSLRLGKNETDKKELLLLEYNGTKFEISKQGVLSTDMSIARPGGNIFKLNNKNIMVTQDCIEEYGKAINFLELQDNFIYDFKFQLLKTITPNDIGILNGNPAIGVHTYNYNDKIEVIDLKYYRKSYYRAIIKILKTLLRK